MKSRWYLKRAIVFWLIALIAGWYGIAKGASMGDVRKRNNCVSEAIINAEEWQAKTGQKALIGVFNVRSGYDHVQAIGQDKNGDWRWLTRHHSDGLLREWQRYFDVEPYRYISVEDFIKEQEKVE